MPRPRARVHAQLTRRSNGDNMPDLQIRLVDVNEWHQLMKMTFSDMIYAMENRTLREKRPSVNPHLERSFTADLEGDFLQWTDKWSEEVGMGIIIDELSIALDRKMLGVEDACEPLSILSQWCSIGEWAAWEARVLLYVEPQLDFQLSDAEELYREKIWKIALNKIGTTDKSSYVESVILDWMERRQALGETMDETKDPLILSTMNAHERASRQLHEIAHQLRINPNLVALIGREWLEPQRWGQGSWNLGNILYEGWPEV